MTGRRSLLYVTPHRARGAALPSRPESLLRAFIASGAFSRIRVVNRLRPGSYLQSHANPPRIDLIRRSRVSGGEELLEHPWPFGRLERWVLDRLIADSRSDDESLVVWVADPKSALVLDGRTGSARRAVTVFDAYDAWDLSPLVVGARRRGAVRRGYAAAARADLVFANSQWMADRMRALGARNVHLLPNAAPAVEDLPGPDQEPYLLYMGRVHERVDAGLLAAVATAHQTVRLRIVGPVERVPPGWAALVAMPSVSVEPPLTGTPARRLVAGARAVLLPHLVNDYTRSQDSMKAWDALAAGTPVVGVPVPPITDWPAGTAIVAMDEAAFVAGVGRVLAGDLDAARAGRLELAHRNGWDARAAVALEAIDALGEAAMS